MGKEGEREVGVEKVGRGKVEREAGEFEKT